MGQNEYMQAEFARVSAELNAAKGRIAELEGIVARRGELLREAEYGCKWDVGDDYYEQLGNRIATELASGDDKGVG